MQPAETQAEVRVAPEAIADRLSAMTPRFNAFFRRFGRRFLRHLELDPHTVATLRALESQGAVVYVMRYPSRLDYFLFNWLFIQNGLRLSGFANGLSFYYYGPVWQALRHAATRLWRWLRGGSAAAGHEAGREHVYELVRAGESLFLFLRAERGLRARRAARERHELDLVGELVGSAFNDDRPVFLVPLALFWRKGPRHARRFLNLAYGGPTRPTDLAKVTGFLLNYRNLKINVGEPIDLRAFVHERRAEGASTLARKVRRSLLLHLYREEKVVEGPPIQPLHRVEEEIFADAQFEAVLAGWARAHDRDLEAARAQAREILAEIAAAMNSTFLAMLNLVVSSIMKRMFAGVEVSGLEKVADYARRHPIVLVPSHRSYFDFLVLSWLFYGHHMVPPHIAARENMAFGPFGFVFRRAGAFFLRRSFDDPLYKEVFRRYVGFLVREGFTQEFFIEGGRSRTGKTLSPKFGYLGWVVDAFLSGARRDLFFIPTAITYERLVEEGALVRELEGGEKQNESVLGLVRARKFLQRRFGTIFVSFGEPISLAQAVGPRREVLARDDPETQEERRRFVEQLGNRLVERINWATVANATCVAACALLGHPRRGLLRADLVQRMQSIVDLLHIQDVRLTPALVADEGEFRESIAFLLRSDLLRSMPDPRGEILYYEESQRRALDLYRNGIIHFLATPSFLARAILAGGNAERLRAEVASWLDLLYQEFFAPREELLAAHVDGFLDYFERRGVVERNEDALRASEKGRGYLRFVAAQTRGVIEGYYAACTAALDVGGTPVTVRALLRSAREQFQRGELLGEIRRPEGGNPVTFQNALDFLVRRGVLVQQHEPGERRRERAYVRGPVADELPALRERLAAALLAG